MISILAQWLGWCTREMERKRKMTYAHSSPACINEICHTNKQTFVHSILFVLHLFHVHHWHYHSIRLESCAWILPFGHIELNIVHFTNSIASLSLFHLFAIAFRCLCSSFLFVVNSLFSSSWLRSNTIATQYLIQCLAHIMEIEWHLLPLFYPALCSTNDDTTHYGIDI